MEERVVVEIQVDSWPVMLVGLLTCVGLGGVWSSVAGGAGNIAVVVGREFVSRSVLAG